MGVELIKVKAVDDDMRLNRWFLKYYPGLGIGRLQKLLRTKQIKVDGKRAETNTRLLMGQEVRVPPLDDQKEVGEAKSGISPKDAEFMRSMIIYQDENIIALNKPSGIAVQGGTNTTRHIDGLLEALQFDALEKPRLVHRIDKDTSGILLLARNRKYADILTQAFRDHQLPKTYLALVIGCPQKMSGEINAPLEKDGEKSLVSDYGKESITSYKVIDNIGYKFALVEASPLTGRTHQIRAHLEHIGTPIVGDDKYYGDERKRFDILSNKLHLHAYKIDLQCLYNKKLEIKAAIPEYFKQSLDAIGIDFKE